MELDLEELRTFVAVAEAGGLTAATGRLGRTVPALSRRIARLEAQLGVPLFDRTTKHFRLTRAGHALLDCGRRLLEDVNATVAVIRQQEEATRREIIIAAFGTMSYALLPGAIMALQARFPVTRIHIRELSSPDVIEAVARQSADLGIAVKGPMPPSLSFTSLIEDPFVLVGTATSRFAARRSVAWAELAGEKLVGFAHGTVNRALIDRALQARGVRIGWHYEVQQLPTALGLMEEGLGLLTLPRSALLNVHDPAIRAIQLTDPEVSRSIGLVQRRDDPPSEAIATFIRCLLEVVHRRGGRRATSASTGI